MPKLRNATLLLSIVLAPACGPSVQEPPPQTAETAQPGMQGPTAQATSQTLMGPGTTAPPDASSNFGTITLAAGFTPDPHVAEGVSGGNVDARSLSPSCQGWVSERPDHIFVATTAFPQARFMTVSDDDTTLVIQTPGGGYLCNDDADGRNPLISSNLNPGTYRIWVGSYRQGSNSRYRLAVSELGSVTPSSLGGSGGATATATATSASGQGSNYGTVSLRAGFTPDPNVVQGTSGGSVNAQTMSGACSGWVSQTPDHVLEAQSGFQRLRFVVSSQQDTTLIVQTPNGSFLCNDDTDGQNPVVEARGAAAGTYRIWVGAYNQGGGAPYKLGLTELSNVTAASLGGGSGGSAIASNFGTVALSRGFTPDPHVVRGTSGGTVNATTLHRSCRGWVSSTPDHIFEAETPFQLVRFLVLADQDTTLVVQAPNGNYLCDDDSEGRNPIVDARNARAGAYRIWVGSYQQGVNSSYTLGITELRTATTTALR